MARIRTIKPDFWTDEKIVKLPFEARLLFIGMWNYADDTGAVEYSPDRLRMQLFPGEPLLDITSLIDLLCAADLIAYWGDDTGRRAIGILNWEKHQKIDNPSKARTIGEDYRKLAIPSETRLGVAKKYGCKPGCNAVAECYYCGAPGKVIWWADYNARPTRWVSFSDLELDHFVSEHSGAGNSTENMVLACQSCNRKKHTNDPHDFFQKRNPRVALAIPIESSPMEGKGSGSGSGSGREGNRTGTLARGASDCRFDAFWDAYPKKRAKDDCVKAWQKLKPDEAMADRIMAALTLAKSSEEWERDRGRYIPHAATWLNRRRFDDDLTLPRDRPPHPPGMTVL